jgi:hypothetical protein
MSLQRKRAALGLVTNENLAPLPSKNIATIPSSSGTLQEVVRLYPELKGEPVWFFPSRTKSVKGIIIYDKEEAEARVYDVKTSQKYASFGRWLRCSEKSSGL